MSLEAFLKKGAKVVALTTALAMMPYQAQASDFSKKDVAVLAANAAIGCAIPGIKKKSWKSCLKGAGAGTIIFGAKELATLKGTAIPAGLLNNLGVSILENEIREVGAPKEYSFSYLAFRIKKEEGKKPYVQLSITDLASSAYFYAKGYEFKPKSFKLGYIYFEDTRVLPYDVKNGHVNFGLTMGRTTRIRTMETKYFGDKENYDGNARILEVESHELIHVLQADFSRLFPQFFSQEKRIYSLEAKMFHIFDLEEFAGQAASTLLFAIPAKYNPVEVEPNALVEELSLKNRYVNKK